MCTVVNITVHTTVNLGFLERRGYFSFNLLLSYPNEAEWTPFQKNYFSENRVAPGIEPETSGSVPRNSEKYICRTPELCNPSHCHHTFTILPPPPAPLFLICLQASRTECQILHHCEFSVLLLLIQGSAVATP
jgi:hypothetical protein